MTSQEIRQKYLHFFSEKNHQIIPSASLIPANDSSTLFISSGMQALIPYLLGEKHPAGQRLVNLQKCLRAADIEEVGDGRHNTFFEMMGNWSLGDYFKNEELPWLFEFLTTELKLDPKRLYITIFQGDEKLGINRDQEAVKIWQKLFSDLGLDAEVVNSPEKSGLQQGRIFYYGEKENWWSRSGIPSKMPVGEIGGGDNEIFYDLGADLKKHENSPWKDQPCHPNCPCGRFIEIGNSVFIEYQKTEQGFKKLAQKNVDFGGGLERMTMVSQNKTSVFATDLFRPILEKISELSAGKKYSDQATFAVDNKKYSLQSDKSIDSEKYSDQTSAFEIIADHLKSATFIMGDKQGISPSNTDQGYIVRRLIRRAIRYGHQLGITEKNWTRKIANEVIILYRDVYQELEDNQEFIFNSLDQEEEKFAKTLEKGIEIVTKLFKKYSGPAQEFILESETLFNLYQTYGFPIELSFEEINRWRQEQGGQDMPEKVKNQLLVSFREKLAKHQELSRTASAGKFKGGLADHGLETTRLHTAAHLLLAALRKVLGEHVNQRGSNITAERLRFDFSHDKKMTEEEKTEVEKLVNQAIEQKLAVSMEELPLAEAQAQGASGVFASKYGERVKVYKIGNFSKEICGGPHVKNTEELGKFKITKEGSSSAGVRRIKAVLL